MQCQNDNNYEIPSPKHHHQREEGNDHEEEEDFPGQFQCPVCLDLLYKPVVLACGHISCFWCVFRCMNGFRKSHCPICRHPFNHFPRVCQLLDFLLMKICPIAYKTREGEVEEEEKKGGRFSPQFVHHPFGSHSGEELDFPSYSQHFPIHPQNKLCYSPKAIAHREENMKIVPSTLSSRSDGTTNAAIENCNLIGTEFGRGIKIQASVADLLCAECKKLLFRPVVLNCGHVYCESCITNPMQGIPRCQFCQSSHPNGFPGVCFVLENFLEEHFSEIYAGRREGSTQAQQLAPRSSPVPSKVYSPWIFGNGPKVHIGVGCDSCGMLQIIGERYKCKDCWEEIGFDVCEACHNNPSYIPGRFNQQHEPEHHFEIVQPQGNVEHVHMQDLDQSDFPEDEDDDEHDFLAPVLLDDVLPDVEDGSNGMVDVSALVLSNDAAPDQEDGPDVS
ncbi:PREDICTED: E3 ubiquitin-protein ligase PRT1-like isoform X2 [Populus euphratica]|uniref:E3 ubiquitin-protein ligase PRT1-like isoform X2 n=1 Tax=Populus euphratica TaxID=75702 RepID=A0AAJ6US46_POPEU|nr:PREDICTED: E3 ubiquitin-protein ligase PRT1-like isoform X2 [Populus euphratica]